MKNAHMEQRIIYLFVFFTSNHNYFICLFIYFITYLTSWAHLEAISTPCTVARVRSMRMGFVIKRWKVRNPPPSYRGGAKLYRGGGARDSRLLLWKPVRQFEDSWFQVFTGIPVTYKFWSFFVGVPIAVQVFTGVPQFFSPSTVASGSPNPSLKREENINTVRSKHVSQIWHASPAILMGGLGVFWSGGVGYLKRLALTRLALKGLAFKQLAFRPWRELSVTCTKRDTIPPSSITMTMSLCYVASCEAEGMPVTWGPGRDQQMSLGGTLAFWLLRTR